MIPLSKMSFGGNFDVLGVMNYTVQAGPGDSTFTGIAAGGSIDQTITFDPSGKACSTYTETLILNPTSLNSSTNNNLSPVQVTLQAEVVVAVPEPET